MSRDISEAALGQATRALGLISNLARGGDLHAWMMREGEPITRFGNGSATPAAGNVNTQVAATSAGMPFIGKAMWAETVTVSVDQKAIIQIGLGGDSSSRCPGFTTQHVADVGVPVVIPIRQLFRGFQVQTAIWTVHVRRMLSASPGTDVINASISVQGWALTDDFAFDADKTILFVGDSILNGGSGPSRTALMWPFKFRDYLRSLGTRARVVLKSVSGSFTSDHETWRQGGFHDIDNPDLIVYALSVNDAGSSVSSATVLANATAFWEWARDRYPNAKVILCGTSPLANNTSETNAAAYRTALQTYVAGVNDARLKYVNLGAAFDRTVSGNYTGADGIHPNDTGHAALASAFNAAFGALGLTL